MGRPAIRRSQTDGENRSPPRSHQEVGENHPQQELAPREFSDARAIWQEFKAAVEFKVAVALFLAFAIGLGVLGWLASKFG